jgi:hypothetical protein
VTLHGSLASVEIGLATIRTECPLEGSTRNLVGGTSGGTIKNKKQIINKNKHLINSKNRPQAGFFIAKKCIDSVAIKHLPALSTRLRFARSAPLC